MSSFTRTTVTLIPDQYRYGRPLYRVDGGFRYYIGFVGSTLFIDVPDGFVTDGPTIPKFMARWLPVQSMMKSAIVHDCLRENLKYGKVDGDAIFLSAMYAEGTPAWLRELAFLAVRLNNSRYRAV